ncbi:MAG: hypothetical protein A2W25_01630 [candidate division Zixibacteria bacterium RBG_16_53_22]|nr:MAG: hypothetical protein A2W25_01630 [candidate division Zixibacteria bacterium RBG_16_53_22]
MTWLPSIVVLSAILHLPFCGRPGESGGSGDIASALMLDIAGFKRQEPVRIVPLRHLIPDDYELPAEMKKLAHETMYAADYAKDSVEITIEIYVYSSSRLAAENYERNEMPGAPAIGFGRDSFIYEGHLMYHDRNRLIQIYSYHPPAAEIELTAVARALNENLRNR